MADQQTSGEPGAQAGAMPGGGGNGSRGRFSPGLLITGLLALLAGVWALTGPGNWGFASMIPMGWILVAGAIVAGLALVISPRKRR
ncbi:hypothetical protein [Nocardia sp. NPDC024068]|uniref:hypothetical protein n=1 Tax=Nocardia sp. NPDC024068 TaxID=3157197 RepID=UPI0033E6AFA3